MRHESEILARFVMRGLRAAQSSVDEAADHQDIIFVQALAALGRAAGPLVSLMLWYRCATAAWPNARHIGKVRDPTPVGVCSPSYV